MANYIATQLLEARLRFNDMFKRPEMRQKPNAVLGALLKNTEPLVPNINAIKNSDSRTKKTMILDRAATTAGTARAHNHTGAVGDSSITTLTWVTRSRAFKMSLKMGDRNEETKGEMFANRLLSAIMDLHADIETYSVAWLNTNKSQVVKSLTPKNVAWDAAAFYASVSQADLAWFAQYAKSFMKQQYYTWDLDCIADSRVYAINQQSANQGSGNDTNLGFQYAGIEFIESIDDLTVPAGSDGVGFLIPKGTLGIVPWIPLQNRQNISEGIYEYSNIPDPTGSGLVFAVHKYTAGVDNSGTFGETQDVNEFYEVSIDFSLVKSQLSTANETPIFKVAQKS